MQGRDFYERVMGHDELEWIGVYGMSATVCQKATGIKHILPISSIRDHRWQDLEALLTGRREARLMTHITRICGYYSRVTNWNKSALARLNDRHGGQYMPPEPARELVEA